jgi:dienelactone hydrolase
MRLLSPKPIITPSNREAEMTKEISRWLMAPAVALALAGAAPAQGEVRTETIEYSDGDTVLTGLLAWDDAAEGKRPGVLVVHEWWGLTDYVKSRAERLAGEGYVAFALDLYGDNKVTTHAEQAQEWMTQIASNIDVWTRRAQLGLDVLKSQEQVDADKTAAIGYCFGGATVMQMAYAGADLDAVVSFHGSLPPAPESVTSIAPELLIAHGRDDAFVPAERVDAFQQGLDRAGADWEMIIFSGTRHGFTNPGAGDYGIDNLVYNETADRRSWAAMKELFGDVF